MVRRRMRAKRGYARTATPLYRAYAFLSIHHVLAYLSHCVISCCLREPWRLRLHHRRRHCCCLHHYHVQCSTRSSCRHYHLVRRPVTEETNLEGELLLLFIPPMHMHDDEALFFKLVFVLPVHTHSNLVRHQNSMYDTYRTINFHFVLH